jgi:hypothetical protein
MPAKLTVAEFKQRYLFGVPDVDPSTGDNWPTAAYQYHIDLGYATLSRLLDIAILPETVVAEQHDYYADDYERWNWLHLFRHPVVSVTQVAGKFPQSQDPVIFPTEWLVTDSLAGHIQMIPTGGTISQFMIGSTSLFLPLLQRGGYIPGFWRVDYSAGFAEDAIPMEINDAACALATMSVCNILGDLIGGVGVLGGSIGLDGLSQFISLSKTATTNALYSKALAYRQWFYGEKDPRQGQLHILKRTYAGIKLLNL